MKAILIKHILYIMNIKNIGIDPEEEKDVKFMVNMSDLMDTLYTFVR
jgi:hypothetical protein